MLRITINEIISLRVKACQIWPMTTGSKPSWRSFGHSHRYADEPYSQMEAHSERTRHSDGIGSFRILVIELCTKPSRASYSEEKVRPNSNRLSHFVSIALA